MGLLRGQRSGPGPGCCATGEKIIGSTGATRLIMLRGRLAGALADVCFGYHVIFSPSCSMSRSLWLQPDLERCLLLDVA